ncbi:tetratricopeptide repeat protein [Litoreibacter roseus]|uniref:TPR repeat n=1 Tax=Litoreibacter roseus TaxID=2601869 RepID=A0A6N6JAP9_9RHOB|nr:SEL1-like repeat protein [Litoreibacter roseus]GFE63206.1 hypothetical protein KIN_02800 [Litoreibacter roseus]
MSSLAFKTGRVTLVSALIAGLATGVTADPIKLEFMPPELDVENICSPREPDGALLEKWSGWTGGDLPETNPSLLKRDLQRLEQIDPVAWYDTIETAISLFPNIDEKYTENHALVDRIDLMVAAGRDDKLMTRRLVPQLMLNAETLSPRFQNILGNYLIEGVGIEPDERRGLQLIKASAYAGNADALLHLAKLDIEGAPATGWDIPPDLAITMALGALVGELNPTICDRIWRIAREFHNGDLVVRDVSTAEAWFRFAADLGDANAAWEVTEYHMESEGFAKDNDILIEYLTKAADGGLPYAKLELGSLYEEGALVEKNFDESLRLYREAAAFDNRSGLLRLARFLEENVGTRPELEEERLEVLTKLINLPDAPGWAFTRLANNVLKTKGRWAGDTEARALLEKAVARDDPDAFERLGLLLMRDRRDADAFNRGIDLMVRAVSHHGSINSMDKLRGAHMCVANKEPMLEQANYWLHMDQSSGTATLEFTAEQMQAQPWQDDPIMLATMQSQALYGRPKSLANYMAMLDSSETASPEERQFWSEYAGAYDRVLKARASIAYELAATDKDRQSALNLMRRAVQEGDPDAAVALAEILLELEQSPEHVRVEASDLLLPIAATGDGDAMNLLLLLAGGGVEAQQSIYTQFAEAIEVRGDFEALLFSLPFVDGQKRIDYLDRAISVMICDFKSTMRVAAVLNSIGEGEASRRWLDTASHLTEGVPWTLVKLGDGYVNMVGDAATPKAIERYSQALEAGSEVGGLRLWSFFGDPKSELYSEEKTVELLTTLIKMADIESLSSVLGKMRGSSDEIQAAVGARVDVREKYLVAAEAGDPRAMRGYAQLTRDGATSADELSESVAWMTKAAEHDDIPAMVELSQIYAFGLGVEPSPEDAIAWLEKAAAAGSEPAAGYLDLLKLQRNLTQ